MICGFSSGEVCLIQPNIFCSDMISLGKNRKYHLRIFIDQLHFDIYYSKMFTIHKEVRDGCCLKNRLREFLIFFCIGNIHGIPSIFM